MQDFVVKAVLDCSVLARTPDKRWSTAGELRAALDEVASSWRFRPSAQLISKLMATVFTDEVRAWDDAQNAGISLADHLVSAKPETFEPWEDNIGTDPEEAVALETRRAPADTREIGEPRTPLPVVEPPLPPPESWWWRHRRVLVGSLIGGVLVGVLAGVLALLSGGGTTRPTPGSADPGVELPPMETLQINPAPPPPAPTAPPRQPKPTPTPTPAPETKVPIVHPPPMPDRKRPKGAATAPDAPSTPSSSPAPATGEQAPPSER